MSVDSDPNARARQELATLSHITDETDASQMAINLLTQDLTSGPLEEQIATLAASLDPEHQVAVAAKIGLILGERRGIDMVEARLEAEFRSSAGFMSRLHQVVREVPPGGGAET